MINVGSGGSGFAGGGGGGGNAPTIVNVPADQTGTITVLPNHHYYVDLHAAGQDIVFNTNALVKGQSFYVKEIDPSNAGTGGFNITINPIVAGNHIENPAAQGTLTNKYVISTVGGEVNLETNDGTNLWF